MTLTDNPIVRSQLREHWRGFGKPLALAALAATAGVFLLYLAGLSDRMVWSTAEVARRSAASNLLPGVSLLQAFIFVLGAPALIGWTLAADHRSGVLEANRLTSIRSRDLLLGYWIGPSVLPLVSAALLAFAGAGLVALGGLETAGVAWVQWQLAMLSTGAVAGLLTAAVGLTSRSRAAIPLTLAAIGVALAIGSDGFHVSAAHLLGGTMLADPLLSLLDDRGSQMLLHTVFGVEMPIVVTTIAVQVLFAAALWIVAPRTIDTSRGAAPTDPMATHVSWLIGVGSFAALQLGLMQHLFETPFEREGYWNPNAWSANHALIALWVTSGLAGLAYSFRQLSDPVGRYRAALRARLGGAPRRDVSPYAMLAAFAAVLTLLHGAFSSMRVPGVLPSVDFDPVQGAVAGGLMLLSWTIVTLGYELSVQRFGRRAPAWMALFGAVVFGTVLLGVIATGDEELFLMLPGITPVFVVVEGLRDEPELVGLAAVLQTLLVAALAAYRKASANRPFVALPAAD